MDNINRKMIVAALGLMLLSVFWGSRYFIKKEIEVKVSQPPINTSVEAVEAVTSEETDLNTNPVNKKIPEVNPVDRTNPFADAYKNPFE